MSFAGSVSAMISSIKNNRANLKSGNQKKPFDKDSIVTGSSDRKLKAIKLSPEEESKVIDAIQNQAKKEKRQALIKFVLVVLGLALIMLIVFLVN